MMLKEAKILKALKDLGTGFTYLANDMQKNDNMYDENYLLVVFEEVKELKELL